VLDTKATNSPNPYLIISDELAYYFAAGIAVMFAQARALGFMMVAAVQDVQGLKRGEAKEEWSSMFANTKVKWTLALEDPEDTYELLKKAGGEGYYSMLSGYDANHGIFSTTYQAQDAARIERKERITLDALKKLNSGEGLLIFKDSVIPSASFYIDDKNKKTTALSARFNRFLQIERPSFKRLPSTVKKITHKNQQASDYIYAKLRRNEKPSYPKLDDPVLTAVVSTAKLINNIQRFKVTPVERGIVLFEAARKALKQSEAAGRVI
jgi:intracellular multiplication protein IcmO